ncbi:LON peptidase substrate-binding domain-containing protein [Planctomicrobium sp. SH661]|uniref:LON peptidase substrate-binding domain-containing protein n=1 Tax=Planctomicrobium sp. SH661 TaxID=3448124 RepID=UPI003F5CA1D9
MSVIEMLINPCEPTPLRSRCQQLPVLLLSNQVLLPHGIIPFPVRNLPETLMTDRHQAAPRRVLVIPESSGRQLSATETSIGCIAELQTYPQSNSQPGPVLLKGISRARYRPDTTLGTATTFAEVENLPDRYSALTKLDHAGLRRKIMTLLTDRCQELTIREMSFLLECELPLGPLCDLSAASLHLTLPDLTALLAQPHVHLRCQMLIDACNRSRVRGDSIPTFGLN